MKFFDKELCVFDASGDGGFEVGLRGAGRQAEHFEKFFAILRATVGPVVDRLHSGERRGRETLRLDAKILGEHPVGGVGCGDGHWRGGKRAEGEEGYERGGAGGEERSKTAVENRAWVHGGRTRGGGGMRPV